MKMKSLLFKKISIRDALAGEVYRSIADDNFNEVKRNYTSYLNYIFSSEEDADFYTNNILYNEVVDKFYNYLVSKHSLPGMESK